MPDTLDSRAREVLKIGDAAFSRKHIVDNLWQEIALNFYPERADFTTTRNDGEEFSDHIFSSYPLLARRELANLFSSFRGPDQFSIHVEDETLDNGQAEREWLERVTTVQRRAMYATKTGFRRATKQGDHDYVAFGNAVIKFGLNVAGDGLLFTAYHLRDNAWAENAEGQVDCNHRNWKPTARQLKHHFPESTSSEVNKAFEKDPEKTFNCRHVVLPTRLYEFKSKRGRAFPFVSLYVERESETVLEETGLDTFEYVIPRWQTISGSVFGRSMATCVALPDGRTAQVVTRVIREAGEKHVDPPMLAVADAIRSDIALYAGGITTITEEYDERTGEVLRPITRDKSGAPIGFEIAAALRQDIRQAFFLDKIQLPETSTDMTAFEVRRRIQEHIRASSPLFEPLDDEYNVPLHDGAFHVLMRNGAFGSIEDMPRSLQNEEIRYRFKTPLSDLVNQNEAEIYTEVMERIWLPAAQIDPAQIENVDLTESTRAAATAAGWKAKWMKPADAVAQRQAEMRRQAEVQRGMETIGTAGQLAQQSGKAVKELQEAGAV